MCRPDWAITASRPTVFNATVFPPVLGPVITRVWNAWPIVRSIGTTVRGARAGRGSNGGAADPAGGTGPPSSGGVEGEGGVAEKGG